VNRTERAAGFSMLLKAFNARSSNQEGLTLWPYSPNLTREQLYADWFEAYERLAEFEPDFAFCPGVRFVVTLKPERLHVTAPLLDRVLAARGRRWDSDVCVWLRCTRGMSSHPRQPPRDY
jgi:hypothetical protein